MKRIIFWISLLAALSLVGCNLSVPGVPGQPGGGVKATDVQMQTQIVQMLTNMPSNTPGPQSATEGAGTATEELATLPSGPTETAVAVATEAVATEAATATLQPTSTPVPATATTQPTASPTASIKVPTATLTPTVTLNPAFTPAAGDPRAHLGNPTATDLMDNARGFIWPVGSDTYTSADFSNGDMVVTALTDIDGWRMANPTGNDFGNLYIETTFHTQSCSGSDHYGVIVRVPNAVEPNQGYLFTFTCDGRFSFRRWDSKVGTKGETKWLLNWAASSSIASGSNKTNKMGIMMVGGRFLLYSNGKLLGDVSDTGFSRGNFGVVVGSDVTKNLVILVDEMSYWENPQP